MIPGVLFLDDIYNEHYPRNKKNLAFSISGGADSALLFYYTAKYIFENSINQTIFPFTIVESEAPFQEIFSKNVIQYTIARYPIKLGKHLVHNFSGTGFEKLAFMKKQKRRHYKEGIEGFITAITAKPQDHSFNKLVKKYDLLDDDRRKKHSPVINGNHFSPMKNHDKRDVATAYRILDIEDLFDKTRSCTTPATTFDSHCDDCWWCAERKWAFGRL